MINKNRLKAAVNKFGAQIEGKSKEEVIKLLLADEKAKYTEEESEEIYEALIAIDQTADESTKMPNDGLDLDQFDYKALVNDSFDNYIKLVETLALYEDKDFTEYKATGVFKKDFDADLNKVDKLIGIKINNDTPIKHTRIPVHVALELNRQIFDKSNPASNSRYYVLRKY